MAMAEAVPALALRSTVSMRLAIEPIAPFNCRTFTARQGVDAISHIGNGLPASMPAVTSGLPVMVSPLVFTSVLPIVTLPVDPRLISFANFTVSVFGSIGHYANVSIGEWPAAPPTIWTVSPSLRATGDTVSRKSQRIAGRARHLCQLVFGGRLAAGV